MGTWLCGWMLFCSCVSTSCTMSSFLQFQSPGLTFVSVGGTVELKCSFEQIVQYCFTTTWHKFNLRTGEITSVQNLINDNDPRDDSKTCLLRLKNITLKDSGLYICISHNNLMAMVGNGSTVIVTRDFSVPELSVLYSPPEAGSTSVQLQCLVLGAVKSQVQVFWRIGEKKYSGWTESAWTNDTDLATEFTRAHLSISVKEWTEEEEIQCCVEYKGQNFSKLLRLYESKPIYSWLVYAGCVAAVLTIIVSITISVVLHRDMMMTRKSKGLTRKDAHRKISYVNQNTLREENPSVMNDEGNTGVC